jgi:4-diphosphocytidyl-2-C-methyl-D-erythritol kinase
MSPARKKPLQVRAPAKINLGLFLGPLRESDGKHELASVMQAISLADELTLEPARDGAGPDEVHCPEVDGMPEENLAAKALAMFRQATGWDSAPVRVSIVKRIPVAAGLGGGSADAAATLRLAARASGLGSDELLLELAQELGADVPAQVYPGRWLATGAGERLRRLRPPQEALGVLLLPAAHELSTAAVYEQADRLETARENRELLGIAEELRLAFHEGAAAPEYPELLDNDLQAAAVALCPEIERSLRQAFEAGADAAFVCGSGPTVAGLFFGKNGPGRAKKAVKSLAGREPGALFAVPVEASFAEVGAAARAAK